MKTAVMLAVLGVASSIAAADPIEPPSEVPSQPSRADPAHAGHGIYVALGGETIFVDRAGDKRNTPDARPVFLLQAGYRVWSPIYVHVALGVDGNDVTRPLEGRAGAELRVGRSLFKAVAGIDVGYVRDWHPWNDPMVNVTGTTVFPRVGFEVGNRKLWLRGMIEARELLGSNRGHSGSGGASIGHDF